LHPFQSTEKFLENGSVQGGRASVGKVAAAAGIYRDVGESDDEDVEELEDSDSDDDDDTTTTNMVTKPKGSTPGEKASSSGGGCFQKQIEGARWDAGARGPLQKNRYPRGWT
jgi:hypothetical protein